MTNIEHDHELNEVDAPALKVVNLSAHLDDFRLGPIDLEIPLGTVTGLIGPNGSGKTTFMSTIMGLLKPDTGLVEVCGQKAQPNDGAWKQNVGCVFQKQGFFQEFSVEQNLLFLSKMYPKWDSQYTQSLLKKMDLKPGKTVFKLTTGEKAKLAFIAAVSHRPALLILDEPTNGMDVVVREEFLEVMTASVRSGDHSALISTHILSDVSGIADHLTYVEGGLVTNHFLKDDLLDAWRRISFRTDQDVSFLPGIEKFERQGEFYILTSSDAVATIKVLNLLGIQAFEQHRLELGEITRIILTKKKTQPINGGQPL